MSTVTTPIATDATLSSGLTAIKNAIADTRGTTSMQCDNSDSWSSSTTYAVGKTVIYDNKVWECLVQNNGQTPSSTSSYWRQVTLSSLNSSLMKKSFQITYSNANKQSEDSNKCYANGSSFFINAYLTTTSGASYVDTRKLYMLTLSSNLIADLASIGVTAQNADSIYKAACYNPSGTYIGDCFVLITINASTGTISLRSTVAIPIGSTVQFEACMPLK